jgi:hypothetical protein
VPDVSKKNQNRLFVTSIYYTYTDLYGIGIISRPKPHKPSKAEQQTKPKAETNAKKTYAKNYD